MDAFNGVLVFAVFVFVMVLVYSVDLRRLVLQWVMRLPEKLQLTIVEQEQVTDVRIVPVKSPIRDMLYKPLLQDMPTFTDREREYIRDNWGVEPEKLYELYYYGGKPAMDATYNFNGFRKEAQQYSTSTVSVNIESKGTKRATLNKSLNAEYKTLNIEHKSLNTERKNATPVELIDCVQDNAGKSQRAIAEVCGCSVGTVNKILKTL